MWLAAVRDLAIVLLAVESLVIGVLLLVLLVQLRKLVQMLREEIKPMLNSANDTVNTVNGTVGFGSNHVVDPIVRGSRFVTGTQRAVGNLMFVGRRARRRPPVPPASGPGTPAE
jgi:hypothetical protein